MKYFEKIYELKNKDRYITAQVIDGTREGIHAIFTADEIIYAEGDMPFWESVFTACKEMKQYNTLVSVEREQVYVEKLSEDMRLILCGAGHVSIQVTRLAKTLGFHVTVIDDRKEFTDDALAAGADEVICDEYKAALQKIHGDQNTYFAIITRGHRCDRACLEEVLYKDHAYIGMIGSKGRLQKQFRDMEADGYSAADLAAVHAPIGLDIGAQSPEEIAVSVMAEIIRVKNSRVRTSGYDKKMQLILSGRHPDHPEKEMAVATIIDKVGSGPREAGTKMIIFADGSIVGTIGGGTLELDVIKQAVQCIREKKNLFFPYEMALKDAEEDGMACGGRAKIYIEVIHK